MHDVRLKGDKPDNGDKSVRFIGYEPDTALLVVRLVTIKADGSGRSVRFVANEPDTQPRKVRWSALDAARPAAQPDRSAGGTTA